MLDKYLYNFETKSIINAWSYKPVNFATINKKQGYMLSTYKTRGYSIEQIERMKTPKLNKVILS